MIEPSEFNHFVLHAQEAEAIEGLKFSNPLLQPSQYRELLLTDRHRQMLIRYRLTFRLAGATGFCISTRLPGFWYDAGKTVLSETQSRKI